MSRAVRSRPSKCMPPPRPIVFPVLRRCSWPSSRVAVLWDSSSPGMGLRVHKTQLARDNLKIEFYDAGARAFEGLETSFAALSDPEALVVTAEPFTLRHRDRILDFIMRNRIPAMHEDGRFAQ